MIEGHKDVEYRSESEYWMKRIWANRDKITHATFHMGYTSTTITRPVLLIDRGGCPYDGWDGDYVRLHLGAIIEDE